MSHAPELIKYLKREGGIDYWFLSHNQPRMDLAINKLPVQIA